VTTEEFELVQRVIEKMTDAERAKLRAWILDRFMHSGTPA
jgi:hypothetical protein